MIFCGCTARFLSDLVENPEDRFSQNEAHTAGKCGVVNLVIRSSNASCCSVFHPNKLVFANDAVQQICKLAEVLQEVSVIILQCNKVLTPLVHVGIGHDIMTLVSTPVMERLSLMTRRPRNSKFTQEEDAIFWLQSEVILSKLL